MLKMRRRNNSSRMKPSRATRKTAEEKAFGLWRRNGKGLDSLVFQRKIREEWQR
jgi:hypothetical protein